jgi:hypothetical protein
MLPSNVCHPFRMPWGYNIGSSGFDSSLGPLDTREVRDQDICLCVVGFARKAKHRPEAKAVVECFLVPFEHGIR